MKNRYQFITLAFLLGGCISVYAEAPQVGQTNFSNPYTQEQVMHKLRDFYLNPLPTIGTEEVFVTVNGGRIVKSGSAYVVDRETIRISKRSATAQERADIIRAMARAVRTNPYGIKQAKRDVKEKLLRTNVRANSRIQTHFEVVGTIYEVLQALQEQRDIDYEKVSRLFGMTQVQAKQLQKEVISALPNEFFNDVEVGPYSLHLWVDEYLSILDPKERLKGQASFSFSKEKKHQNSLKNRAEQLRNNIEALLEFNFSEFSAEDLLLYQKDGYAQALATAVQKERTATNRIEQLGKAIESGTIQNIAQALEEIESLRAIQDLTKTLLEVAFNKGRLVPAVNGMKADMSIPMPVRDLGPIPGTYLMGSEELKEWLKLKGFEPVSKLTYDDWLRFKELKPVGAFTVEIIGKVIELAAGAGDIEYIDQILTDSKLPKLHPCHIDDAMQAAARGGHKDVIDYFFNHYDPDSLNPPSLGHAVIMAAEGGHRDLVDYLCTHNYPGTERIPKPDHHAMGNAAGRAALGGYKELVDHLFTHNYPGVPRPNHINFAIKGAAEGGHRDLVDHFLTHSYPDIEKNNQFIINEALDGAPMGGHQALVTHLFTHNYPGVPKPDQEGYYLEEAIKWAAWDGHQALVDFFFTHNVPGVPKFEAWYIKVAINGAVEGRQRGLVDHLFSRPYSALDLGKYYDINSAISTAASKYDKDMVEHLLNHTYSDVPKVDRHGAEAALRGARDSEIQATLRQYIAALP